MPNPTSQIPSGLTARPDASAPNEDNASPPHRQHGHSRQLLGDLARTTSGFGFSDGDEAVWGLTALAGPELRPVAGALASAPGAVTWWEPAVLADQRFLHWDGFPRLTGPAVEQAVRDGMRAERARNAERPFRDWSRVSLGTRMGAHWWSAPDFAELAWTTSAAGDIPAAAFGNFIDTLWPFEETGVTVWSLAIAPGARVLEVTGPAAWQALVARFPRDVTGTHDGQWRYWGGVPGPWLLPDWELVTEHYDGVHVTVGGLLASCGLALPVGDGYTMLAGWIPGATLCWTCASGSPACPSLDHRFPDQVAGRPLVLQP